jgi:hypothetical protein
LNKREKISITLVLRKAGNGIKNRLGIFEIPTPEFQVSISASEEHFIDPMQCKNGPSKAEGPFSFCTGVMTISFWQFGHR